jgi:phage baseplate assembly protein V
MSRSEWKRGLVKEVDPKGLVKVSLPDEDGLTTDWLPVAVPFALGARAYWLPRVGSQVVLLLDENAEDGVVLGALYSKADPAPVQQERLLYIETEDGTKISVDPDASLVTVDTPGKILAKAGGTITAQAQGNVSVSSQADVDVSAQGHVNTTSATATVKASTKITLDAPLVNATQVLKVDGPIQANGGITTTSGGSSHLHLRRRDRHGNPAHRLHPQGQRHGDGQPRGGPRPRVEGWRIHLDHPGRPPEFKPGREPH